VSAQAVSAPAAPDRSRSNGTRHVYRAELRKLLAQPATRALTLVCAIAPFGFSAVLSLQSGLPADTLLGVWVHSSGYSLAFVVLGFCGYLGFPVIAGVLAGDVFSSEDRYGTWKSVLTRSRTRGELFAGKCLAVFALTSALLLVVAVSSLLAGALLGGGGTTVGLSGNVISGGHALDLLALSWLLSLPPLLAFASLAVLLSAASRSGIVGVLGPVLAAFVMQLLSLVGNGSWMHELLITTAFNDWHGVVASPRFYAPLLIALAVSLLWVGACLWGTWLILRRRDFAGPPVARRAGWLGPARTVAAAVAVVALLGLSGGFGSAAITRTRLQDSLASAFERLTVLQQHELGRSVPDGAKLEALTRCFRHAARSVGPGDDWSCTITLLHPSVTGSPLATTSVTYDTSVKSEGCYRAQAPPAFVGSQTMTDTKHRSVVNPLFVIYGCFDTTSGKHKGVSALVRRGEEQAPPAQSSAAQRKAEKARLRQAEQQAGSKVIKEITEAEQRAQREAEGPEQAPEPHAP
jgi:ABC-2 type transport system permease protein